MVASESNHQLVLDGCVRKRLADVGLHLVDNGIGRCRRRHEPKPGGCDNIRTQLAQRRRVRIRAAALFGKAPEHPQRAAVDVRQGCRQRRRGRIDTSCQKLDIGWRIAAELNTDTLEAGGPAQQHRREMRLRTSRHRRKRDALRLCLRERDELRQGLVGRVSFDDQKQRDQH
jgi:hypothetical protein